MKIVTEICQIVVEYWKYPIITSTNVYHKAAVDFPGVTVCNLNRINCHNAFQVDWSNYVQWIF